ncbi:MAG: hypothetical protein ACKO5K_01920 [Armatimonadota bacterium]
MEALRPERIIAWLHAVYGTGNPNRGWAFAFTAAVIVWLSPSTRKLGWFCILGTIGAKLVFGWLGHMIAEFTPRS